jgi:hypothetical protein
MAVLTEFFVTTADHAAALALPGPYEREVSAVLAQSIDPVKVASLYKLATGLDELVDSVHEPVDVDRPDGPWLVVLRDEVTAAIAGLSDDRLSAVSDSWAATEEWHRDGASAGLLVPIVRELRDLARQAQPPSRRLYLWMSL